MTTDIMPLRIDIVSDVVCPWCIIGYRQLSRALASMSDIFAPSIHWHPFELNPDMPSEGQDLREHLRQKYGPSAGGGSGGRERLESLGASLGFEFDYYEGMRMRNTFSAHQLLHWSAESGLQTELKLELFSAYFQRREDVSDEALLAQIAARAGLDAAQAQAVLADRRYAEDVRSAQRHWREQEVHAVPAFYFQQQYFVPGAQDATTFERILTRIHTKEQARSASA